MDDRDFKEYRGNYKRDRFLGMKEYVSKVISENRTEEIDSLVRFFGLQVLELISEGKKIKEIRSILEEKKEE